MIVFAEGVWCRSCEFFEDEDFDNDDPDDMDAQCQGCGCRRPQHSNVKVVED